MKCLCKQKEVHDLKVEGDIGADPIWCNQCGCNLDIEDIPISLALKSELMEWVWKYGKWIDWDKDGVFPNGIELEEEHNKQGMYLTEKLRGELEDKYKVSFSPSTFARRRADK
ncbi:hypothetical protein MKY15_22385 [Sporosarcina sp. FSL K6-1540]|uniref:Uncharacterized protein n=1 Tax=Sporosarcina psychrophila TaxID=1476 RepID=A0ABV2K5N2_SPOPS|nr:hypothetical protein [Sporosarcina sp. resist]QNK86737.1 hypothetical protein H7992_16005 [Sporosarcina sp. resist]